MRSYRQLQIGRFVFQKYRQIAFATFFGSAFGVERDKAFEDDFGNLCANLFISLQFPTNLVKGDFSEVDILP